MRQPHRPVPLLAAVLLLAFLAHPAAGAGLGVDIPTADPSVAVDALAIPLPAAESWESPWAQVDVEVYADGRLVHQESFEAQRRGEESRVELLAHAADERQAILNLARQQEADLEVRVLVDGSQVVRDDVLHLLDTTPVPGQEATPFTELRFPATTADDSAPLLVTAAAYDCTDRNACLSSCLTQRDQCYIYDCDGGLDPREPVRLIPEEGCDHCETEYIQCRSACPPCTCVDPKNQYTTTQTVLISIYNWGWSCMEEPFEYDFYDGFLYDETQYNYRQDTIEVTEYCDGTSSQQVISSSYFSTTCLDNTYLTCMYPWQQAWYGCI